MKPIDGNGCQTTQEETVGFAQDIGRSTRKSDSLVRVEPGRSKPLCGAFLGGDCSGDGMTGARPADMDCYHCYSKSVAHENQKREYVPIGIIVCAKRGCLSRADLRCSTDVRSMSGCRYERRSKTTTRAFGRQGRLCILRKLNARMIRWSTVQTLACFYHSNARHCWNRQSRK